MDLEFWKLHAAGNDFIIIDNRAEKSISFPSLARYACHRHYGIGADGLIASEHSSVADIRMVYCNSDGSYAAVCGNGLRCFAKFVRDNNIVSSDYFSVETGNGAMYVSITEHSLKLSRVTFNITASGKIQQKYIQGYELSFLHLGVPHSVVFINAAEKPASNISGTVPDLYSYHNMQDLIEITEKFGAAIENDPAFNEGTNVNFVRIESRSHLTVSTWERGAGRTSACGTGACASALAAFHMDFTDAEILVSMPGGEVIVTVLADDTVKLDGTSELICKGVLILP